jgi:hypothetical protein
MPKKYLELTKLAKFMETKGIRLFKINQGGFGF